MTRTYRRLVAKSFHVVISGFLLVVCVYVILMHHVTQNSSRDASPRIVPESALVQHIVTLSGTLSGNASTLRSSLVDLYSNPVDFHSKVSALPYNATTISTSNSTVKSDVAGVYDVISNVSVASGRQISTLLAGSPRPDPVYLSIGIPTLQRQKGDYFFTTLSSLLTQSSPIQQREITIVVILADRDPSYNNAGLHRIKTRYPQHLQSGLLLVISAPDTEHLFRHEDIKRTFNDSIQRVRWRSKQNLDYAALMEFCVPLATYYLQIEDDVLAAPNYVQHIQDFIKDNSGKSWAGLEVCPHGFIGKLFRGSDLPKLVSILRVFYLEMPCDFLIRHFYSLMLQKNVIRRKGTLFFHQGKYSSLINVTRKVDRIPWVNTVTKVSSGHINPTATLFTSMKTYKEFVLRNAYNSFSNQFFWASDIVAGDSVTVVFLTPIRLGKVIIETGFPGRQGRDKMRNATVEAGQRVEIAGPNALCTTTYMLGEFKGGRFEANVTENYTTKCITIVVTHSQKEWLVMREIAVYPRV